MLLAGRVAALAVALAMAGQEPVTHVAGRIHTEDRRQLLTATVILIPVAPDAAALPSPTDDVRLSPDGIFRFGHVAPGRYEIRARADVEKEGTTHFGTYAVEVRDRAIENIDLVLRPGATIEGTVIFPRARGAKPPSLAGVRVRAPLADGTAFGDALSGDVRPDGSFRIRGVMPGTHALTIEGLPAPWTIASTIVAGRDVVDAVVEVQLGQRVSGVRITCADTAPEVAGTVSDGRGTPAANAIVVVVPVAEQFWSPTSRRVGVTRTDGAGRYRLRGLPAGEYRAAAALEIDEREARTRLLLRNVAESGAALTLADVQPRALDLTAVPAASLRRGPAR